MDFLIIIIKKKKAGERVGKFSQNMEIAQRFKLNVLVVITLEKNNVR